MSASRPISVRVAAAHPTAPLGAQQKKFNRHVERIAEERQRLAAWQQATAAYRERYVREALPAQQVHFALLVELVQWLDAQSSARTLTRAERGTLSEAITDRLAEMLDAVADEALRERLKEVYNRHSGSDYDAEEAEGNEAAKDLAQAMARDFFGVDLDLQDADMDSPEDLLRRLQEQMQARQAQAEQQRQTHHATRARKPGARERKAQEAAQQATQSVREVYRKLASHLHPDRESDPAERERKTALMQRVNQAYADNKLLDLLQLQLELEQIDPAHMAGLGDERLKHYNRVLAEQLAELQQELQQEQDRFLMEFELDPYRNWKPAALMGALRAQMQVTERACLQLRKQLNALRADPAALKAWIKAERRQQKARGEIDFWL